MRLIRFLLTLWTVTYIIVTKPGLYLKSLLGFTYHEKTKRYRRNSTKK